LIPWKNIKKGPRDLHPLNYATAVINILKVLKRVIKDVCGISANENPPKRNV